MKWTYFFLAVSLLFTSCEKEEVASDLSTTGNSFFSAKLDGVLIDTRFPEGFMEVLEYTNPDTATYYSLVIGGLVKETYQDALWATMSFNDLPKTGIFEYEDVCIGSIDCMGITYTKYDDQSVSTQYTSGLHESTYSSFKITTLEFESGGRVKGTFSGTILDFISGEAVEVTEGQFDVIIK